MTVVKVGRIYHMYYEAWGIRSETIWSEQEPDGTRIYIGGPISGKVYCIDTEEGSVVWTLNVREIPEVKNDPFHIGGEFR